jgi:hypothetical protein
VAEIAGLVTLLRGPAEGADFGRTERASNLRFASFGIGGSGDACGDASRAGDMASSSPTDKGQSSSLSLACGLALIGRSCSSEISEPSNEALSSKPFSSSVVDRN